MYKITHMNATSVDDAVANLAQGNTAAIAGGTDAAITPLGVAGRHL